MERMTLCLTSHARAPAGDAQPKSGSQRFGQGWHKPPPQVGRPALSLSLGSDGFAPLMERKGPSQMKGPSPLTGGPVKETVAENSETGPPRPSPKPGHDRVRTMHTSYSCARPYHDGCRDTVKFGHISA